jgi:hypothetical protein
MTSAAKLKCPSNNIGAIGFATVAGRQSPSQSSLSRPSGRPSTIAGHRTYLDNPRLISTRVHRAPVPRGHRQFIGKVEWR